MSEEEQKEDSVENDIMDAMESLKEGSSEGKEAEDTPKEDAVEESATEEEKPKEDLDKKEEQGEPTKEEESAPAPQSWSKDISDKWKDIPKDVQEFISKREEETHQLATRFDAERSLGKEIKDIVTPYMPLINAANSTPTSTITNLLNTAYRLQTGDAATKEMLVKQIAADYGVSLEGIQDTDEYVDPRIAVLERQVQELSAANNPQVMDTRLQERLDSVRIQEEINAFASDPANVHFERVKPQVAALISSGQVNGLKEAYDAAIWASPEIRSTLIAKQESERLAKRKQEVAAKKNAASSISGGSSVQGNTTNQHNNNNSVEDDIKAAIAELNMKI